MAKSYILSVDRYDAGSPPSEGMRLREFDPHELDEIGNRIQRGEPFEFDLEDVRQVIEALQAMESLTSKDAWKAFLKVMWWLKPMWIVIAIALILFFFVRR